jgi:endonuclease/exonuclease/phosphatase family metal-dependent hydrolase
MPGPTVPPVTVATWNLWWRFGPWEARQAAIVTTLRAASADLICLQEVWAEEGGPDQAAVLADALGMHHVRSATPYREGVAFGNAVLSRWPITSTRVVVLPRPDGRPSHRQAVVAHVESPRGDIPVISTHIDHRFDASAARLAQTAALAQLVHDERGDSAVAFPTVVGADLNAVPDSDEIRALTGRSAPPVNGLVFTDAWEIAGDGSPGFTWRKDNPYLANAQWPNRRLDYVLVSWPRTTGEGTPVHAELFGTQPVGGVMPSDHAGLLVHLR